MTGFSVHTNHFDTPNAGRRGDLWLLPAALAASVAGWLVARSGLPLLVLLVALPLAVGFVAKVFLQPRWGLWAFVVYCFIMPGLGRHVPGQLGLAYDGILVLTWLGVVFWRTRKFRRRHLHNDLVWMCIAWFVVSVLQLANPSHPDPLGWLQEVRGMALYWVLITPLVFLLFNKRKDIPLFAHLVIVFSVVAALYGARQLHLGVDGAEQAWLDGGPKRTHIVAGKLRVFSFYAEAAQFGASQGQVVILCVVLALGPWSRRKRVWYWLSAAVVFYGMLISGTRGAMGALLGGGLVFLILSRQMRILVIGLLAGALFIGFLKFTAIANGNDQIRRLRSSTNANDPSLQVRLANQRILSDYLKSRPFGTGVGTTGTWGSLYNRHIPIASIPPDSLFVKIWVMYGVVGLTLWLGMMLFITGKCAGIVWNTKDPALRNQLTALLACSFGGLVCSFGNEVLNQVPTLIIAYAAWPLIWMSLRWDRKTLSKSNAMPNTRVGAMAKNLYV